MTTGLLPLSLGKFDALVELAQRAGVSRDLAEAGDLRPFFAAVPTFGANADFVVSPEGAAGLSERVVFPDYPRPLSQPSYRNGRPASFPEYVGFESSPALRLAEIDHGFFVQFARAPLVVLADGRTIPFAYSSRYAPLIRSYACDLGQTLAAARRIPGEALVLCDEIYGPNYCHWLIDTLPRLAAIGMRPDVSVIVCEPNRPFKQETLRSCGISDDRIVWIEDFAAVRADRLLVTSDCHAMPHPGHKAAAWVLDFLRSRIPRGGSSTPIRLYVSRADAAGRRVLNDDAMMRLLAPLGYQLVTLSQRSVADQAALFAGATHIVGLHGAGLANIVFCQPGARLLEIFAASYGTPAFYVLAAGAGVDYASYVARDVVAGSRSQVDDVTIDLGDFVRCCGALL